MTEQTKIEKDIEQFLMRLGKIATTILPYKPKGKPYTLLCDKCKEKYVEIDERTWTLGWGSLILILIWVVFTQFVWEVF